jgi:hypothetical protein
MNRALLILAVPCLLWTQGPESAARLKEAGIERVCVPADASASWSGSGITPTPISDAELAGREVLLVPGVTARAGLASPTRAPWVNTNGSRFLRKPEGKYRYSLPAGRSTLAAAEAAAYGADAILEIDPSDLTPLGLVFKFIASVPPADLPPVTDLAVVDDGSAEVGEAMNLFVRRNLLFAIVPPGDSRFDVVVRLGSNGYARDEAADPSALALKVRRKLTDARRSLRIFGSEVVIARLGADASRARVQLLNYGRRDIEDLRVRVRGTYASAKAYVEGDEAAVVSDFAAADGATEVTLRHLTEYAVIDLVK